MKPTGGRGNTGEPTAGSRVSGRENDGVPGWTKWVVGSVFLLAIPFCRRLMKFEGKAETVARVAAEDVEEEAPAVEKLAADIAEALPEGSRLGEDFVIVEGMAEKASEEAKMAEAFIDKVAEIKEEAEKVIEPIIKEELEYERLKL